MNSKTTKMELKQHHEILNCLIQAVIKIAIDGFSMKNKSTKHYGITTAGKHDVHL